ncbi:MAG TPA: PLP-dependent aspartate aminotransferase family protein [Gaiellaceae bacterium]|jgi:cystathionine gamma-synthase
MGIEGIEGIGPVDRSTIWPYDERGEPGEFYYSRYAHPTGVAAEHALGELESGDALLYASGMGATTAIVLALTKPGDTIALADGAYYGTSVLFRELERWGIQCVEFDQTTAPPPDADVVWVEAPANPTLTLPNWATIRSHPGLKVCDATVATPVYLKALDEGADVVLHSATKFLTGGHDALLGATVTRDPELTEQLRKTRTQTGITAAPDAAHALLEGLATLERRMRRHTESATEIARRLTGHPAVERVRYPGFSGLISFDVAGDPRAVETATRLIMNATSLGGTASTMESRHRWEGDRIPRGLLRLSVGLEDVEAIWADLAEALRRARP